MWAARARARDGGGAPASAGIAVNDQPFGLAAEAETGGRAVAAGTAAAGVVVAGVVAGFSPAIFSVPIPA
jgi:hypothetical protein